MRNLLAGARAVLRCLRAETLHVAPSGDDSWSGRPAEPAANGRDGPLATLTGGAWLFSALWINGERRTRARSPNEGYFFTAGKAAPAKESAPGEKSRRASTA